MSIEAKLLDLGITLPEPVAPVANYVPFVRSGNLVSISGQLPMGPDGPAHLGKVGVDVTMEDAVDAARWCAVNLIAQLKAACDGDLSRITRIIRLGVWVNCEEGFAAQPNVANGASDLMVAVFGDRGRHSRAAVGVNALPLNVPVEIDCLAEIAD